MDPQKPTGNSPVEPSDLSFQVMPQGGESEQASSSASPSPSPKPAVPLGALPRANMPMPPLRPSAPLPPPPAQNLADSLPVESDEPSFFRSKWIYIAGGAVVLIGLGLLAYFMLFSKKSTSPDQQTVTTRLPKIWLQQYFNTEVCTDQTTCGDDADPENDGLKNYDEFVAVTNPTNNDTDVDGLSDGDEVNIYKTDPKLKYTDRREIVSQSDWTDGFQIKNGYDPLTPGLQFTDARKQQIADDTAKFSLHQPTISTLASTTITNPVNQNTGQSSGLEVAMQNNLFSPNTITVNKGDTVVWTNKDLVAHTVTGSAGGPASGNIPANGTYSFTFNTAGTFTYHCTIHPLMTGSVVVK